MFSYIAKKIFGTKNARVLKGLRPLVAAINALEPEMRKRSDEELRAMTPEFRRRLDQGPKLDSLLPARRADAR